MSSIGERIKKIRIEFKLNQKEFADKLETSQKSISEYERNITSINEKIIANLIKIFKIDSNWLIAGQGEMFINDNKIKKIESNNISENIMEDFKTLDIKNQKAIYLEILTKLKEEGKI